jgi:hypothetical protein
MHKTPTRMMTALALFLNMMIGLTLQSALAAEAYQQPTTEHSAGAMAIDAVAVRPLGLIATALGTGIFLVSLPFSTLGGNVDQAAKSLVVAPARFTFVRPLGEYNSTRYNSVPERHWRDGR